MIHGEKIIIRPVRREDLESLQRHKSGAITEDTFNNFGFSPEGQIAQQFERDGFLNADFANLVVTDLAGSFAGTISYHSTMYGPARTSLAYNIGISLDPAYRGKGYGVEAQRLLAQYLLDTYPVMRIEASTDVENRPEQRALEKAGFTRDGIIRGAQWRSGAWHDLVLYSKLRGE